MKVDIKNYQSLRKAHLDFDEGLTIIVGETNSGKSAIFRALETAFFNDSHADHITMGESKSSVCVEDNNLNIKWSRDTNKPIQVTYDVNGKEFTKVGRGQLEVVKDLSNISEIDLDGDKVRLNFQKQMSYPFLLDRTPSQLFKFISQSTDGEDLLDVSHDMKLDLDNLNKEVKELNVLINDYKNQAESDEQYIKGFADEESVCNEVIGIDSEVKRFQQLRELIKDNELYESELGYINKRIDSVSTLYNNTSHIEGLPINELRVLESFIAESIQYAYQYADLSEEGILKKRVYDNIDKGISSIKELTEVYENINTTISDTDSQYKALYSVEYEEGKLKDEIRDLSDLSNISDESISSISSLQNMVYNISDLTDKVAEYNTNEVNMKSEIDGIVKSLESEFDVCPYCGNSLKGVHDGH